MERLHGLFHLIMYLKVGTKDEKGQFDIVTSKKKYSVRTPSLQEATAWVEAINQEVFGPPLPGIICKYIVICY